MPSLTAPAPPWSCAAQDGTGLRKGGEFAFRPTGGAAVVMAFVGALAAALDPGPSPSYGGGGSSGDACGGGGDAGNDDIVNEEAEDGSDDDDLSLDGEPRLWGTGSTKAAGAGARAVPRPRGRRRGYSSLLTQPLLTSPPPLPRFLAFSSQFITPLTPPLAA